MASKINKVFFALALFLTLPACAGGNKKIDSFNKKNNSSKIKIWGSRPFWSVYPIS